MLDLASSSECSSRSASTLLLALFLPLPPTHTHSLAKAPLLPLPPPRSNATNGSSENPSAPGSNSNIPSFQSSYEASYEKFVNSYERLDFPPLFSTSFGPAALLYSTPTLTNPMSYGEGISGGCATDFSIMRPTIELPLDRAFGGRRTDGRAYAQSHTHAEDTRRRQ